ncbi:MAG: aminomethyl-transferring glycine dehydrogenase subunit GcvPA [Candidatus Dormibacteraeota bacterium]|nr:aminomethyl-transferring glycine dehydrogenase subunit GcvPA [Candidatus Dormibacteraeota bacterium]
MPYLVHADPDRAAMLAAVGAESEEDLLVDVPKSLRLDRLDLPDGLSELDTVREITRLADRNHAYPDRLTFRGAGVYRRFVPAAVQAVTQKPEFYTAYTPYQPEASQGTLQAIFEYQTLIAELTALDASNASLYDGATAAAEAVIMAGHATGRRRVVAAPGLHPEYLEVLRCYGDGRGFRLDERLDELDDDVAAVLFQHPDCVGRLRDPAPLVERAHQVGALAVACVDPVSLAVLAPPGEYGADVAVGEGQQLGLQASYGGPHLGFIAVTQKLIRRLPGRLVGQAHDHAGRRGFVLTLTAREQHIRRAKATSNICTNHSLCALAASVYLTYLGPDGLRRIAEITYERAHHLALRISALPGYHLLDPETPFWGEFAVRAPDADQVLGRCAERGILAGFPLRDWYPDDETMHDALLFCCTEVNDVAAMETLLEALAA